MKFPPARKLIIGLLFCGSLQTATAQTNATFQNCQIGDVVRVKCDRPLLVLGKATLLEIDSNTVTVATASDHFTLSQTNVTLLPMESHVATAIAARNAPASDIGQTMEFIRAFVIDPNSTNSTAQSDKADAYYQQTMTGVLNGSVSQADLVRQAKEVLALCDKYAAERKNDPQYEKQFETLRDFVRRSEAGEKIDFGKPVQ